MRPIGEGDFGILWAAYLRESFDLPKGMDEKTFVEWIYSASSRMTLYGIEDDHRGFKSGRGLVGLVSVTSSGWVSTPVAEFFKWASPRHVLRGFVAFFHMYLYTGKGVVIVMAHQKHKNILDLMIKYGVLYFRATIPDGCPNGALVVYSIASRNGSRFKTHKRG